MRPFGHFLIAGLYGLVALAAAVALPYAGAGMAPQDAVMIALAVFALAAFAHSVIARIGWSAGVRRELGQLAVDRDRLYAELFETREQVRTIQERLAEETSQDAVRQEVRQVYDLLGQLSETLAASGIVTPTAAEAAAADATAEKGPPSPIPKAAERSPKPEAPKAEATDQPPAPAEPAAEAASEPEGELLLTDPLMTEPPTGDAGGVADSRLHVSGRADIAGMPDEEVVGLLTEALAQDRIDVAMVPVVTLPQRKLRHYEAYTRAVTWSGHFLLPDQYQALAEREGLIVQFDNFLLLRCIQLVREHARATPRRAIFAQVSTYSLGDADFMRQLIDFLTANARLASHLVLQLRMDDLRAALKDLRQQLNRLGELGFRFAVDGAHDLARLDADALAAVHIRYVKVKADVLLRERRDLSRPLVVPVVKRELDRAAIDLIVDDIGDDRTLLDVLEMPIDYGQGALFGEPRIHR